MGRLVRHAENLQDDFHKELLRDEILYPIIISTVNLHLKAPALNTKITRLQIT
jgi:hypothetical protein